MHKQILLSLAIVATLGLAACGPGEEPKTTAQPGAVSPAEPSLSERAAEAAREATQVASEKVEAAATAASDAAGAAKESVSEAAGAAMEKGQELVQASIDKADALIQQVKDYIAEDRLDLAQGIMEQLRALRDSLPQGLQDEIARLEAMLGGEQPAAPPSGN
ncbi:MAG: hypothetical protein ACM3ST_08705 [Bdellovibrio bacteriovorus]